APGRRVDRGLPPSQPRAPAQTHVGRCGWVRGVLARAVRGLQAFPRPAPVPRRGRARARDHGRGDRGDAPGRRRGGCGERRPDRPAGRVHALRAPGRLLLPPPGGASGGARADRLAPLHRGGRGAPRAERLRPDRQAHRDRPCSDRGRAGRGRPLPALRRRSDRRRPGGSAGRPPRHPHVRQAHRAALWSASRGLPQERSRSAEDRVSGAGPASRLATYARLRDALSSAARAHWDARPGDLAHGVLHAGASERFLALVVRAIKTLVHPERRVRRLLACRSVAEQRAFYEREWNTWRWRALFKVLLNRWAFRRSHEPAFFEHVENPSFSGHFLRAAQHALTDLPVADNYFLHVALTGWYPPGGARPPYLTADGATSLAVMAERLTLVDGSYTAFLRTQPDASVTGFALSNICEWLSAGAVEQLFAEIVRTAAP